MCVWVVVVIYPGMQRDEFYHLRNALEVTWQERVLRLFSGLMVWQLTCPYLTLFFILLSLFIPIPTSSVNLCFCYATSINLIRNVSFFKFSPPFFCFNFFLSRPLSSFPSRCSVFGGIGIISLIKLLLL